jgi:hypothetical protein
MAREVRKFSVATPPGTLQANPLVTNLNFPPREVRRIKVVVPPGPRGNLGWQIAQAGNQIFPTEPGAFFTADGEVIDWEVEGANNSGAWQLISYNTGVFAHAVEIRFFVDLPADPGALLGSQPLSMDTLRSVG